MIKENLNNPIEDSSSNANKNATITTAIVERIFPDIKESPFGADFINGRSIDEESGEPNVFLVDLRDYNFRVAAHLLGQKVTLEKRKNGYRLRPLQLQPKETIKFLNQLNDEETIASTKVQDNESGEYKNDSEMGMPKILEGNISDSQEFVENLIITLSQNTLQMIFYLAEIAVQLEQLILIFTTMTKIYLLPLMMEFLHLLTLTTWKNLKK